MDRQALVSASVQPGGRPPAPGPLALVQAFVNTVDAEHGPDLLDTRDGLEAWLQRRGLDDGPVSERDLSAARDVREALRALLIDHADRTVYPEEARRLAEALDTLDTAAHRARLTPRFTSRRLESQSGGVDGALGTVLAVAFSAMVDGTWPRLKACPGHRCGWAFYDRSPAVSATWCSMQICGGRAKARAYYERRTFRGRNHRTDAGS